MLLHTTPATLLCFYQVRVHRAFLKICVVMRMSNFFQSTCTFVVRVRMYSYSSSIVLSVSFISSQQTDPRTTPRTVIQYRGNNLRLFYVCCFLTGVPLLAGYSLRTMFVWFPTSGEGKEGGHAWRCGAARHGIPRNLRPSSSSSSSFRFV